jgi:histidinol-phosphate aminotransferase
MNACDLALPNITALQPYQPGKPIDELERELGISNIIKLASNENPLGPSQAVLSAIAQATKDVTRYPDGNGFILKAALAKKYQLDINQITLGNGSNDVLELLARTFVSAVDEVIFSQYAFAVYPLVTQAIGAKSMVAPARDYGHDLEAMSTLITDKTKLIFIANPNNPTGTALAPEKIQGFLQQVPSTVIVVLDEAYVEYTTQTVNTVDWLKTYPNLVITRTFSKAFGLAALRVGYSLSHPDVADVVNRIRQPFNVNGFALAAATAALTDDDYLVQTKQLNDAGMQQFELGLQGLGLDFIPSKGNFICVDVKTDAERVFQALLQQGVITRPIGNYGLPQHLRISIGREEDNQRCLDALATTLDLS